MLAAQAAFTLFSRRWLPLEGKPIHQIRQKQIVADVVRAQPISSHQLVGERASLRLFLEAERDELGELIREVALGDSGRRALHNQTEQLEVVLCGRIGIPAEGELEQDQPKGPDVGAVRVARARQSLRRHVARAADEGFAEAVGGVELRRDAEVGNLHLASLVQQDVGGLQVAVHLMVLLVQVVESIEHLQPYLGEAQLVAQPFRMSTHFISDRTRIHVLEDHQDLSVLVKGVEELDQPRALVRPHDTQLRDELRALGLLQYLDLLDCEERAARRVLRLAHCAACSSS
mmetsp:Transcript_29222/g.68388  ORF Transcript_29222/g.68388 Transcript_29222/m.68388 type:complete len:288 (+) Transcript_29222:361-1224(+)